MHALRIILIVAVILIGTSDGLLVKKFLLKKTAAVKAGFLADVKAAALKFKAGAALKKDAILGKFKALGKAKLGIIGGIKAAKLKLLGGIAAAKLAKIAALKAGKLAFIKTLTAAKLAPLIAKKFLSTAILGKKAAAVGAGGALLGGGIGKAGGALLGGGGGGDIEDSKPKNILEQVTGLIGGLSPFGDNGGENLFGSFPFGDLFLNALTGGGGGGDFDGGQKSAKAGPDFLSILGGLGDLGSLAALIPKPDTKPTINIQSYQVNPAPQIQTHHQPLPISSGYGAPNPSYVPPSTSYGIPLQY